jgi:anhydro-N-acetylmuramic acid kinase
LRAFENKLTLFELCRLNYAAGAINVEAMNKLLKRIGLNPEDVDIVGYRGQTTY